MRKFRLIILTITISTLFSTACEDILEPSPQGQIALDDLLTTEKGVITAVNGIYQPLHSLYELNMLRLTDLASDDGWTWRKETEPDIYIVEETFNVSQDVWSDHYTGLTRANSVLANIDEVEFSDEGLQKSLEGQAKFMRAFYYFNLVRLFGGVPLIIDEIKTREDAELPRASMEDIYSQIFKDLEDAIKLLPTDYQGGAGMETGRPTYYTANALKSLVHLELEEWSDAAETADLVIGHGSLLPNYADNFNGSHENGEASLFEVQYGGVTAQTTGSQSIGFAPPDFENGSAFILPTDDNLNGKGGSLSSGNSFIQIFDEEDLRKDVIVQTYDLVNFIDPSQPDGSLYYINKYYNTSDPRGLSTWNYPLIRYAEILLVKAEALNEQAYVADGEAFELLNSTRTNAGLPALTSGEVPDQNTFRKALRDERRKELAFEAKRFFDLNRWGVLQETIQEQMDYLGLSFPVSKTIEHPLTGKSYYLYPIPSIEFVNNANLGEQNPGY